MSVGVVTEQSLTIEAGLRLESGRILAPVGTVDTGTTLTPACSVYNAGTSVESYSARMKIGTTFSL